MGQVFELGGNLSIWQIIVGFLLGGIIVFAFIVLLAKLRFETAQLRRVKVDYNNLLNRMLAKEAECTRIDGELQFLKDSIVKMMSRPVVAMLNEQHAQNIAGAVIAYVDAQRHGLN